MKKEVHKLCDQTLHIYLFYLVGITLFIDKRATYVDVAYLRYSRDLEVATGYSWGVATHHTCIRRLTMLPIGTPSICQDT